MSAFREAEHPRDNRGQFRSSTPGARFANAIRRASARQGAKPKPVAIGPHATRQGVARNARRAKGSIRAASKRHTSRGPQNVTHHTRVLTTGRMVPVVRPASIPTRGSRTRIITSGRPGTGHGRRQRERVQAQRRRAVAVRGAEARRVSRQLRGRSTGKIKSGGRNFTKRGPKR